MFLWKSDVKNLQLRNMLWDFEIKKFELHVFFKFLSKVFA